MWRSFAALVVITLAHLSVRADAASSQSTSSSRPAPSSRTSPRAIAAADTSDSVYTLPPIQVKGARVPPVDAALLLPGQVSIVSVESFHGDIADVATVLDRLPGLSVRDYGSAGGGASVSIRGASPSQVRVYLDGVPLARAGLGLTNLAELPFAGLDHIAVYRGFAPPGLPGSAPGGAIQLVTPPLDGNAPRTGSAVVAAGSFGSGRLGLTQEWGVGTGWRALVVFDALRSEGDFEFHDDNGTEHNLNDDEVTARINNAVRRQEILAKAGHAWGRDGRFELLYQWVDREQGVPGITSNQSTATVQSSNHHMATASMRSPARWGGRLRGRAQAYYDWRRDTFVDAKRPSGEIGLGLQDNRDVSETRGVHVETSLRAPLSQRLALHIDARHETFMPWRQFPKPQLGPEQQRRTLETALDSEWLLARGRLRLQGVVRASQETDRFAGDLRTPYSKAPAVSGTHEFIEPRAGMRLRLLPGVHLEASAGGHHRTPGFLELFGDGGSIAGSSDLVAEEGKNSDIALDCARSFRHVRTQFEVAFFRNHVEQLIIYLPQSQRTFVARNIGAADSEGEELQWLIADASPRSSWSVEGNYTRLRTEDLGVDIDWYAGKALPSRPAHQLFTRVALRFAGVALGYDYRFLGQNYLDRWNRDVVTRRDLHGVDLSVQRRNLQVRIAVRNLTDDRARDVAGFPLPGRVFSLGSDVRF